MARPREIPGLDCEEPFFEAASRVIRVRADEVFGHAAGVLAVEEPERVHDMRVATRRLRAALEAFEPCFPRRRWHKTLRKVKALGDALGKRRDGDVQIGFLESLEDRIDTANREAVTALIVVLAAERQRANEELAPFVSDEKLGKLRRRIERLLEKAGRLKDGAQAGVDPGAPLRPSISSVLGVRLAELRDLGEAALEPPTVTAQHGARIAAKRLRYLLEIFGDCFEPAGGPARDAARELQAVLGDLHDCDVLMPRTKGIESLEILLAERRTMLFARFLEVWRSACHEEVWDRLDRLL